MAKLGKSNGIKKIDLEEIILNENIRFEYSEIEELAASIERDGQIQPVVVDENNNLIAGYRRFKAHEFLVSEGKSFNQIEAIVKNGNFDILQLTENIQRNDLSAIEKEKALQKLIDSGMSQMDISKRLNKRLTWVSDSLAGLKVREKTSVDTSELSTSAVSALRSVPEEKLDKTIKQVIENGGTTKAAKQAVKKQDKTSTLRKPQIEIDFENFCDDYNLTYDFSTNSDGYKKTETLKAFTIFNYVSAWFKTNG